MIFRRTVAWVGVLFAVALMTSARSARAQSPSDVDAPAELPVFSITVSPIHLILPLLEVTGELRLADKVGAAGIFGVGSSAGVALIEVGGQGRYYLLGNFRRGLMLGGEVLFVAGSRADPGGITRGGGLQLGPFIGYKWISRVGFTFDTQFGLTFYVIRANNSSNSVETGGTGILINLNFGWSF